MSCSEMFFPIVAVSAFCLLGGLLAWASRTEGREQKKRRLQPEDK